MEIMFHSNILISEKVPIILERRFRFRKKNQKMNNISCQANGHTVEREGSNLYKVLSLVSENVGFDEIKKAYRSLALQYHPDLSPSSQKEESTKKFVQLQKAYKTLSDPISRKRYDRQLSVGGSYDDDMEVGSNISRTVWEDQLHGLELRSRDRIERKNKRYV